MRSQQQARWGEAAVHGRGRGSRSRFAVAVAVAVRGSRSRSPLRRRERLRSAAFTLVELLTVIAIISVLAGLTLGSVSLARKFGDRKATEQEIQMLVAAANRYNTERGDYPPSTLGALKVKGNNRNEGIEALILAVQSRKKGGPYHDEFKADRLENRDADRMAPKEFADLKKSLDLAIGTDALFEYVDLWTNPFVYLHNRDYATKAKIEYTDRDGGSVSVQASKSQKLGTYQSATSFQIWSFGPNGVNENGEGDDITSWK